MIADLKPYPSMKDSGVEWIGEVPQHWTEKRAKYFYREVDERSATGAEELLSVSHKTGVTPRKQSVTMFMAESNVGYKICRPNDIAINTMWAFMGALGVSRQVGLVSPSYGVYRPTRPAMLMPKYIDRLLRLDSYKSEFTCRSTGINSSRLRLYPDEFLRIPLECPPLPEQAAIVRYLDHVDRRVRRLARAKRKLIALLTEQKQAIIHHAVTRGLDPDVPLKDSGVEWLGEVPEHWDVVPLKRAFISMDYGISDSGTDDGTIPVLTMGHIRDGTVTVPKYGGVHSIDPSLILQNKDLLFNRTNSAALVAKVGLFRSKERPVTFASYLVRMRSRQENDSEYLNLLLNNQTFLARARREAIPSLHQSNLNPTRYGRLPIPLPPNLEQEEIRESVSEKTFVIDEAIDQAIREIELLNEYRTRLTADVVTGKLDVRKALEEEADAEVGEVTENYGEPDQDS